MVFRLEDRRGFLTSLAAGASVAAVAVIPKSIAAPLDDSALLKLEEMIFEEREGAMAYDDEIIRLSKIWINESKRLAHEVDLGHSTLTPQERWDLVTAMPECKEHDRLVKLQDPFYDRMNAYMEKMFAMPAHTAEGRCAKVTVLLVCIMGSDWSRVDAETDYPELTARNLLIEFIGGEPGEMLRDQFA
jgi:hypothetical protein